RGQAQPGPAADAVLHGRTGAAGSSGGGRDPDVDAEQAPLPRRPVAVRPAQRQRGVLRGGPSVRADRGHGDPRRRAGGGAGVAGGSWVLTLRRLAARINAEDRWQQIEWTPAWRLNIHDTEKSFH